MSGQVHRFAQGGRVDRNQAIEFEFDGQRYSGFAGDTLASALLANGVRLVGRSFKYHRPRGVMSAGVEEPNALIQLGEGERTEPNLRATQIELTPGLVAHSQNRWPSLSFDISAVNNLLSRFMPPGFYYKTFKWPAAMWMRYEHVIRKAAGLGKAPLAADPDLYCKRFAHCDVLVVGGGPAGVVAAHTAMASGARVVLVEERPVLGGQLRAGSTQLDGQPWPLWLAKIEADLDAAENVRVLRRATAFGYYDQNLIAICEQLQGENTESKPRQRIWWMRAQQVVLATGAIERPMVFANNDLPGIMLASAAARYASEYAVRCGDRAVVFGNNDSIYESALTLHEAGVQITAVVDVRSKMGDESQQIMQRIGAELLSGHVVIHAKGGKALQGVSVQECQEGLLRGPVRRLECDLLGISGGWNPTVHLHSQAQGKLRFDDALATFVPAESFQHERSCGAANGAFELGRCLEQGRDTARDALQSCGFTVPEYRLPTVTQAPVGQPLQALWEVPRAAKDHSKCFIDFQNDVSSDDVRLAARENYASVEHLKRYTTLGMGTDQGRTSNVNGLAVLAATLGAEIPAVGTTTFRPPYTAVSLGAIAGEGVGQEYDPLRRTPLHDWHLAHGGEMLNVGLWQRCRYYRKDGESMRDSIRREAVHVRNKVGMVDVSTFGKICIQGRDAAEFLERVAINRFHNLRIGRCRYHILLREDGFIMDDGTTTRVGENSFYMTTTTAAAGPVMAHFEYCAQTLWPELQVHPTSITDQWAGLALAGPRARDVLAAAVDEADVGNDALPFMACVDCTIADLPVRIFRITFSGELGYEVHMPADTAVAVWERVLAAGAESDLAVYGTEAMGIMRIEKGHLVHAELNGRTNPEDFGFHRMIRKETDFIGRRSLQREAFSDPERKRYVGLISDSGKPIPEGAQLVWNPTAPLPMHMYGEVTSTCYSPNLERYIALGFVENAAEWQGKTLYACSPLTGKFAEVRITDPVFIDPAGERPRA